MCSRGCPLEAVSMAVLCFPLQPCRFFPMSPPASASTEDSYVPMSPQAAASALGPHCSPDDYIPMSSGSISSPLPKLPADLEPPPVNRDLKPQRKRKLLPQACCVGLGSKAWWPCGKASLLTVSGKGTLEKPAQRPGKHKGREKWLGLSGEDPKDERSQVHSRGLIFGCFPNKGVHLV